MFLYVIAACYDFDLKIHYLNFMSNLENLFESLFKFKMNQKKEFFSSELV